MISTSGSGQMLPLPMNEYLQQNLKEMQFRHLVRGRRLGHDAGGAAQPADRAAARRRRRDEHQPPTIRVSQFRSSPVQHSAERVQLGHWKIRGFRRAVDKIEKSTIPEGDRRQRKAHEIFVDDAAWLFIVHDLNARAMTKKVKGFISAQSWFQDFTRVTME